MRLAGLVLAFVLPGCSVTLEFDGLAKDDEATPIEPGSVGNGIVPDWQRLPITEIVDGFVHDLELVVAVREHGNSNDGALLAVDLETGARRLVAGKLVDAGGVNWDVGGGSYLHELHAARTLADGSWAALVWNGSELGGLVYPVDPVSGDRGTARMLGASCTGLDVYASGVSPVLGESGEIWLPFESTGLDGVLRISETECRKIELDMEDVEALRDGADALWFVSDQGVVGSIDHETESVSVLPGQGAAGTRGLAVRSGEIWTVAGAEYTRAAVPSGERTPLAVSGPAAEPVERAPNLWLDRERLVVERDGAISVISTATGASRVLSY